jgi:hypothetical protein
MKVSSLLMVVFLLFLTVHIVSAQQDTNKPSSGVDINKSPVPSPSPATSGGKEWTPNGDSYNNSPFVDLTKTGGAPPTNTTQVMATPKPTKKPQSTTTTNTTNNTTTLAVPVKVKEVINTLFGLKGLLWNGHEYVGIIVSSTNAKRSYAAKAGDILEGDYRVLQISDKEVILVKDGTKSKLLLEVEK